MDNKTNEPTRRRCPLMSTEYLRAYIILLCIGMYVYCWYLHGALQQQQQQQQRVTTTIVIIICMFIVYNDIAVCVCVCTKP